MSERVFLIGAGKVGRGLARAFRVSGIEVVGLHARSANEEATSVGDYPQNLSDANVIIIAVRDAEIDGVCATLAKLARERPVRIRRGTVVLHTSGTAEPANFKLLRDVGMVCGTFHPLVPFASAERGAQLVAEAWVGIDGDATACGTSRRLAAALGARTVNIPVGGKAAYHAAAVMASNFPVVLAAVASGVLADQGIPVRTAEQIIQSLMSAAVGNLEYGSPLDVLTGPAVRGETAMMNRHLEALRGKPEAVAIYELLSRVATTLVSKSRS